MEEVFNIEDLVRREILPFLTLKEANNISLVSKNFNTDVKDTIFNDKDTVINRSVRLYLQKFPMSKIVNISRIKNRHIDTTITDIFFIKKLQVLIINCIYDLELRPIYHMIRCGRLTNLIKLEAQCSIGLTDDILSNLINLQELDISVCTDMCHDSEVTGKCFKHMPKLKVLNINNCFNIKNTAFDFLSNLHELQIKIDNPWGDTFSTFIIDESINKLKSIKILNLYKQKNLTDTALKYLTQIEDLTITGCELITDAGISHLKNIKYLSIGNCWRITGSAFKSLPDITYLYAVGTNLTINNLKYLERLERLDIGYCRKLTDDIFQYINNIRYLGISYNKKILGNNVSDLKNMRILDINNCNNIKIDNIVNINKLDMIIISKHCKNHMKDTFIEPLKKFLKEVKFI
jgi:hypothetical protein